PALRAFSWTPGWDSNQASITRYQDEVGGRLKGGAPGVHLLSPSGADGYADAEVPGAGEWQAVPRYRIFGSEPLSARAPASRERMSAPTFSMNEATAETLGVESEQPVELTIDGRGHSLPVAIDAS